MEIKIENLTKIYGTQRAVDQISFELKSGEVLGFLGPNGAGKSTTMKMISCFIAPDEGQILVDNHSIFTNPEQFKARIGYLPENNPLYEDMFVVDYLKFATEIQQVPKGKRKTRIDQIIEYTGLGNEKHKRIAELSKGYKQRVGLAQALIHDPEILILDEPTSGLDPNQIIEIRQLIKNLGREKTILLSTHIMQEVEATCDRIIIINKGKIVADAQPDILRGHIQGQQLLYVEIESDLPVSDLSQMLKQIETVSDLEVNDDQKYAFTLKTSDSYQSRKAIFDLCVKNKAILLGMHESEAKLEDIFRQLTTNQS